MYAALSCFRGSDDQYGYEKWERNLKDFFSYFILASEQKCRYTQMKLVGKAYCGGKTAVVPVDVGLYCKTYFVLGMLHTSSLSFERL